MVSFLDVRRDPQDLMSGAGLLVVLTVAALAVLDDVYVAGVELLVYFLCEVAFYLWESFRYMKICESPNIPADSRRMRQAMDEFLGLAGVIDFHDFLEGWFLNLTKIDDIKHENMVEFIAYGFYSKRLDMLTDEERVEIEEFLQRVVKAFKQKGFVPGYNPDAKFMGHTLEPIRTFHKPLILYAFMEVIGLANLGVLWWLGFKRLHGSGRISRRNMSMFIRKGRRESNKLAKSLSSTQYPLVFIHGVGFGVLPYVHFLSKVLSNIDRPCIVVEMRHVAMRLSLNHRSTSLDVLANDIVDQMQAIGFEKGFFLSHSVCIRLTLARAPRPSHASRSFASTAPSSWQRYCSCGPRQSTRFVS